jgi:hypothetical protein
MFVILEQLESINYMKTKPAMAFLMSRIHHIIQSNIERLLDCTHNVLSLLEPVSEMQQFSLKLLQKHKFFISHRDSSHGCHHQHTGTI